MGKYIPQAHVNWQVGVDENVNDRVHLFVGDWKASNQPMRWLIMVRMCRFTDVETVRSVIKLMAILSKGESGIPIICKGYICVFVSPSCIGHNLQMSLLIPFQ